MNCMKLQKILFLAAAGTLFGATGAETVFSSDFSAQKWNRAPAWTIEGDTAKATQTPGKWPALSYPIPLEKNNFYRCSFQYRTSGSTDSSDKLLLHVHKKYNFSYPPVTEWTTSYAYFHAADSGKGDLMFQLEGKSPFQLQIRKIQVEKLSADDRKRIRVDFASDNGPMPAFFRKHFWKNAEGSLQVVPAEDHIEGGKAMRITARAKTGKTQLSVYSLHLPLEPGKRYRLSLWAKADPQTPFSFYIDGYVSGQKKHWYKGTRTKLTARWEKQSMEFSGPAVAEYPQMAKQTAYLVFSFPAEESEKTIHIHSVELEQLGK